MNQHEDSPRDTLEAVRCCDAFHAVDAATRVAECGACGQRWHVAAPETDALTVEAVAADVVAVAVAAADGDDEAAHHLEDNLLRRVLQAIAEGRASDPAALARAALTASDVSFRRWFA